MYAPSGNDSAASRRPTGPPDFVVKLFQMLQQEDPQLISWDDGRIVMLNPSQLANEILPKYFRHSRFSSFQRQLNNFGFRKIEGKGKLVPCMYARDDLQGQQPVSLLSIRRKTTVTPTTTSAKPPSPQNYAALDRGSARPAPNDNPYVYEYTMKRRRLADDGTPLSRPYAPTGPQHGHEGSGMMPSRGPAYPPAQPSHANYYPSDPYRHRQQMDLIRGGGARAPGLPGPPMPNSSSAAQTQHQAYMAQADMSANDLLETLTLLDAGLDLPTASMMQGPGGGAPSSFMPPDMPPSSGSMGAVTEAPMFYRAQSNYPEQRHPQYHAPSSHPTSGVPEYHNSYAGRDGLHASQYQHHLAARPRPTSNLPVDIARFENHKFGPRGDPDPVGSSALPPGAVSHMSSSASAPMPPDPRHSSAMQSYPPAMSHAPHVPQGPEQASNATGPVNLFGKKHNFAALGDAHSQSTGGARPLVPLSRAELSAAAMPSPGPQAGSLGRSSGSVPRDYQVDQKHMGPGMAGEQYQRPPVPQHAPSSQPPRPQSSQPMPNSARELGEPQSADGPVAGAPPTPQESADAAGPLRASIFGKKTDIAAQV